MNLNKVLLIGRVTNDPQIVMFNNGGKGARFGIAINNRKFNQATNTWEDEPTFVDCDCSNKGDYGKLADHVEQYLFKGYLVCIEGHLKLDRWNDQQSGQARTKLKVVVDKLILPPKITNEGVGQQGNNQQGGNQQGWNQRGGNQPDEYQDEYEPQPQQQQQRRQQQAPQQQTRQPQQQRGNGQPPPQQTRQPQQQQQTRAPQQAPQQENWSPPAPVTDDDIPFSVLPFIPFMPLLASLSAMAGNFLT